MSWVKLHIGLRNNRDFRRMSDASQNLFFFMLMEAKDLDNDGVLATRNAPLTVTDLADMCGREVSWVEAALPDLLKYTFIFQRLDGAYVINRWDEKSGATDPTNADRQKKWRNAHRNAHRNAGIVTDEPLQFALQEKEKEKDNKTADAVCADSANPPAENPEVSQKPKHQPSEADLAAYKVLDAAWPVVRGHVAVPITAKTWKQRNKSAAADFVASGTTPEQVVQVLLLAYEHPDAKFYAWISRLDKLAMHWPEILQRCGGSPNRPLIPGWDWSFGPPPDVFEHGGKSHMWSEMGCGDDTGPAAC